MRTLKLIALNLKYTGVSGCLPAVFTRRTPESDAWTLHRLYTVTHKNGCESKFESESTTGSEMTTNSTDDDSMLGREKSEETYLEWEQYWINYKKNDGFVKGDPINWVSTPGMEKTNGDVARTTKKESETDGSAGSRRWFFSMRHGERVDLTYGQWVQYCFDDSDNYTRKDLNMPLTLGKRAGGKEAYAKDTPLTRVGRFQAFLVGEGMRLAGVPVSHVYSSPALRSVETATAFLQGLRADESVKIRVDPGLFEYKLWYATPGLGPFMTPAELVAAGHNVDLQYTPSSENSNDTSETVEHFYSRYEKVARSALRDTEKEGGNIMFVGHAITVDLIATILTRLGQNKTDYPPYQMSKNLLRVPYCALGAVRDSPWEVVAPPVPPSINSSSGRYDWRLMLE